MLDLCIFGENGILVKRRSPDGHLARISVIRKTHSTLDSRIYFEQNSARSSVYQKSDDLDFFFRNLKWGAFS